MTWMHVNLQDSVRWLIYLLSINKAHCYGFSFVCNFELFVLQEETVEYVQQNMWSPVYPTIVYKKD